MPKDPEFIHVATSNDESTHNIGITSNGQAFTWGTTNLLGQLGRRSGKKNVPNQALLVHDVTKSSGDKFPHSNFGGDVYAKRGFVGGFKDAGHSAILDTDGYLWFSGCDRWQQLGLGSSTAGATGYTWKNGALWQETFQRNDHLRDLMIRHGRKTGDDTTVKIRDVAIGGDHTLVLSENRKDVFAFGKGREGQLGLQAERPFVSTPVHAKGLSSKTNDIAAICAVRHCSFTLDGNGDVLKNTGQCKMFHSDFFQQALQHCRYHSQKDSLISKPSL